MAMRRNRMAMAVCLAAGVAATAWAQQEPPPEPPPAENRPQGGRGMGRGPAFQAETTGKAVAAVATNAAVAGELGLTEAQVAVIAAGLDAQKVRLALEVQRLAETVTTVLTDPRIAADLNLTEGQKLVIRQKMTAELLLKTLTAEQVADLGRAASPMGAVSVAMDAMRSRAMQFDADGDGQLSEPERHAAREAFRRRMEEMGIGPGREGGRGRGPRDGDEAAAPQWR